MWIFTSDGPWLGGKRVWLRPGERHLFGRTTVRFSEGQQNHHIDERMVSRQHLIVEVSPVPQGGSAHLHARTEVRLTDSSKIGTTLNGDSFTKSTRIVGQAGTEFTIQLGKSGPLFRLRWHTVALTFSNLPKGAQQKQNALLPYRDGLEQSDIKILTEYVANHTTHVVAKKRNNPAVLQALTQAKFVVTDTFANALIEAVRKRGTDANGDVVPSLLEEDFDAHWPDANEYIPHSGDEPTPRPKDLLRPNPARAEVFKNFIFIFQSKKQFDNLIGVITGGGGKAYCHEFEPGVTRVENLIDYARSVSGPKKSSANSQEPVPGGVVFVRRNDEPEEYENFERKAQLASGQRSIIQNELLDIVLTLDTSGLRRPLEEEEPKADGTTATSAPPKTPPGGRRQRVAPVRRSFNDLSSPSEAAMERRSSRSSIHSDHSQPQQDPVLEASEPHQQDGPPRKQQRRMITQSRFKGFDDVDPTQFTKPDPESLEMLESNERFIRDSSLAMDEQGIDDDEDTQGRAITKLNLGKRKTAQEDYQELENARLEEMLAGANRLKRQRTEAPDDSRRTSARASPARASAQQKEQNTAKSKQKTGKDESIAAGMKKLRENEDEVRRQEEEKLRLAMQGIDISSLKDLAKVETMEMPGRVPPQRREVNGDSNLYNDRWDPAWNGRKNFKRFQRQGERRDRPRLQRVIVTLEEVPRRGHGIGIGDEYVPSGSSNPSTRKSQSQSQSIRANASHRAQPLGEDRWDPGEDDDDAASFRRRIQISREEDAYENDGAELIDDEVRGTGRSGGQASSGQSFRQSGLTQASASKRPAQEQGGTASKRVKQSRLPSTREVAAQDDDDDDDDGLKFRRRRK